MIGAYFESVGQLWRNLFANRSLFRALVKRDIGDDYVHHGWSRVWPFIHPLVLTAVYLFIFTVVFPARGIKSTLIASDHVVYLLSGIIPWILISQALSRSLISVVNNSVAVKQMAFPLELLPLKSLSAPLLSGAVSLVVLLGYGAWVTQGQGALAYALGLPVLIIFTVIWLVGLALLFSAIQVFVRDFREVVNIFLAVGLFIHPILYFPDAIPEPIQPLLLISPFTYLLYCWQDVFFFGEITRPVAWVVTPVAGALVLLIGSRIFMASRPHFGDFL